MKYKALEYNPVFSEFELFCKAFGVFSFFVQFNKLT